MNRSVRNAVDDFYFGLTAFPAKQGDTTAFSSKINGNTRRFLHDRSEFSRSRLMRFIVETRQQDLRPRESDGPWCNATWGWPKTELLQRSQSDRSFCA